MKKFIILVIVCLSYAAAAQNYFNCKTETDILGQTSVSYTRAYLTISDTNILIVENGDTVSYMTSEPTFVGDQYHFVKLKNGKYGRTISWISREGKSYSELKSKARTFHIITVEITAYGMELWVVKTRGKEPITTCQYTRIYNGGDK